MGIILWIVFLVIIVGSKNGENLHFKAGFRVLVVIIAFLWVLYWIAPGMFYKN